MTEGESSLQPGMPGRRSVAFNAPGSVQRRSPLSTTAITEGNPPVPPHPAEGRRALWRFARHYAEMVVAMYVGMVTLSPFYAALAARAGYSEPWGQLPVISAVVMAVEMTIPMALLMAWHRHRHRVIAEMGVAMLPPPVSAAALLQLGAVLAGSVMPIAHVGFFPGHAAGHGSPLPPLHRIGTPTVTARPSSPRSSP